MNLALVQMYFDKQNIIHDLTDLLFHSIMKSCSETGTLREREYNEISKNNFDLIADSRRKGMSLRNIRTAENCG